VAFGLKARCGWAVLVVVGVAGGEHRIVDRRRIELVEGQEAQQAKQPYHAAAGLDASDARDLVKRATEAARRVAVRQIRAVVKRSRDSGHDVAACAVLVPEPMPDWSTGQILAVHFRMHKAEGALFPDALVRAAELCGLAVTAIPQKQLAQHAVNLLATELDGLTLKVATLGKSVGPPWGSDQKNAALAVLMVLQARCQDAAL